MIKWLICLLWGHDIDVNKLARETWKKEDGELVYITKAYCNRCQKFKDVT